MSDPSHNKLIKSSFYFSITAAIIILCAKFYGFLATYSQSILASLVDSLLDVSASLINLIAVHFALQPPDHEHRFGHEKFQDLAVFSQSIFFFASSLFTIFSSFRALFFRNEIYDTTVGTNIMYFCIVITCLLVAYQTYVIKKTKSLIIEVDKLHYLSDFLTTVAVIISIKLSSLFWYIDSLTGVAISLYILYSSYTLFKQAIKSLADEELPDKDKQKILSIISKYPEVKGVHELKTRYAANKPFIQFHAEMDGNMSLLDAHAIGDKIIDKILQEFPGGEVTIHQDPEGVEEMVNYRERLEN